MTKNEDGTDATLPTSSNSSTICKDVMIEIPKIGYRITKEDTIVTVSVTDDPNAEGFCYADHSKESLGDCDKIYIGSYFNTERSIKASHNKRSISYSNMTSSEAFSDTSSEVFSFFQYVLLQCLFIVIYKTTNYGNAIGYGALDTTYSTGALNSSPFCSSDSEGDVVKFLGIEDLWSYYNQYCLILGGVGFARGTYYINYKNLSSQEKLYDSPDYTYRITNTSFPTNSESSYQYVVSVVGNNICGFLPESVDSGSMSTGYCSNAYSTEDSKYCVYTNSSGLFGFQCDGYKANKTPSYYFVRIMLRHISS